MGYRWCMNRMKEHSSNRIYFLVSYQKFEDNKMELVVRQKCYCKNNTNGATTMTGDAKPCHSQNFPWWRIEGVSWTEIFSSITSFVSSKDGLVNNSGNGSGEFCDVKTVSELQELLKSNIITSQAAAAASSAAFLSDDTRSVVSASSSSSSTITSNSVTRRLVRNFTDESLRKKIRMD